MKNLSLPTFSIDFTTVEKKLSALLKKNLTIIDELLESNKNYTWENLLQPIEDLNDALHQFWSPIHHMGSVVNSEKLRKMIKNSLPKLSDYHTHISHNDRLFAALQSIKNGDQFETLSQAQQKTIDNHLRDFKLSGIHLPEAEKEKFAALSKNLSQLAHRFEENVLDATMAWKKHITDETLLSGIPLRAKNAAKKSAEKEDKAGFIFTLEAPDYIAIMTYADSRELRKEVYHAYMTRASDMSDEKKYDNTDIMRDIMRTRFALSKLLGYENFAEYSLATKMVKKPKEVIQFLTELCEKSFDKAKSEFRYLSDFAKKELGLSDLNAWDVAYLSEKLRQHDYDISPEDLRPYFPESVVFSGLFTILNKLYDITLEKAEDVSLWHQDASCFRVYNGKKELIAHIYFDLYARPNKRGGAWMDDCLPRRRLDNGDIQLPAAYVTCNFQAPIGSDPALFTHSDVETLFHECGHALQHILTTIDVASVSGIQGIPWDAVEIASQFFENWCWEKESVDYIAQHYQTKEPLPLILYERMQRAKNFQTAMQMMRQLEFSLFDFRLHMEYNNDDPNCIQAILNDVRQKASVVPVSTFNRFQHCFTHIFGGGYAAGYYSYKWAEVMACDAFSLFEEKGLFNHDVSKRFENTFLASGGAVDPMTLFIEFRGRKPSVDALLRQTGVVVER